MTKRCKDSVPCVKPKGHDGECATEKELYVLDAMLPVVSAARALLASDTRRIDGLSDEGYRAWCALRNAVASLSGGSTRGA